MKKIITGLTVFLIAVSVNAETKLSWEAKDPKNSEWTKIVLAAIEKKYEVLNSAEDVNTFCPRFISLGKEDRIHVWGEIFSAMAFYESSWNPKSQFTEHGLGLDSVTGLPVVSEGLLQMSYADSKWASWCHFDWEADKKEKTFNTTILNPKNNLECGVGIMARQIKKYGRITMEKGVYWSVLRIGSQRTKIDNIAKMVKNRIPACGK